MTDYGRPGTKAARTRKLLHELLLEHECARMLKTTGRYLFYELEQRDDATKPDPSDARTHRRRSIGWPPGEQDIIDALTWLREQAIVPWDWIADEERQLITWRYSAMVAEYVADSLEAATIDRWAGGPPPMLLCESKATAAVLRDVVSPYGCPISGLRGQSAGHLHTRLVPWLRQWRPRIPKAIYLGDLDRSGEGIEQNTRAF